MNYVHGLFLLCRSWTMVRAVVEEAATLASLALFMGMLAIWAQVIATLRGSVWAGRSARQTPTPDQGGKSGT